MKICDRDFRATMLDIFDLSAIDSFSSIESSKKYSKIIFSVFDHWLSEEEAREKIILYDKELFSKDDKQHQTFNAYEKSFLKFYKNLFDTYNVYVVFTDAGGCITVFKFESLDDYQDMIKKSVREEGDYAIIIPDLKSVILPDWSDFTYCIHVKNDKSQAMAKKSLSKLIKDSGLFILP